jgi:hypothetical protein
MTRARIARCRPLNMAELCRLARLGIEAEKSRQKQETDNG